MELRYLGLRAQGYMAEYDIYDTVCHEAIHMLIPEAL